MVDFGSVLKPLRLCENMTQEQLAQKLCPTKSVISAYENNLHLPSYDILIRISRIFNVSTDYLLGLENKQEIDHILLRLPGQAVSSTPPIPTCHLFPSIV